VHEDVRPEVNDPKPKDDKDVPAAVLSELLDRIFHVVPEGRLCGSKNEIEMAFELEFECIEKLVNLMAILFHERVHKGELESLETLP